MNNPLVIGLLRGLGVAILTAVLSYFGSTDHLPFLNPATASIVAALALALEHAFAAKTGDPLFGAVARR